ncbi:MAG: DUF2829 domain-containing protein [Alphaproteobacteria bacterium]|nr:DUF2829 domain-containing protein [Alphaproteobacteria bacterium]
MDKGKLHIGTKLILAVAMTRLAYSEHRGWELPEGEEGSDAGFLVEYIDGGKPNHPDHKCYISWSPEDVFHNAYKSSGEMSFGMAIEAIKRGHKIARSGWNGKGMFLIYVPASPDIKPVAGTPYSNAGITQNVTIDAHIDMFTAGGSMQPGWLASQADILANDWCIVD